MTTKTIKNPERMKTAEAAEFIGCHPQTLAQWRHNQWDGGPPWMKIGGKVFYRLAALKRWIKRHTRNDDGNSDD